MADQPRTRTVTLSASKAGITRLRTKGGASPETLLDLTNGYVNASKCPQQRPGTTWLFNFANTGHTGNAGNTKGLVAYKGIVYTFTHDPTYATSGSSSYVILILRHPTNGTAALKAIHYAAPFMGFLYVVAEFADAVIGQFWLQNPSAWTANTFKKANDIVQPTTPNGYYYTCRQSKNPQAWTANLSHQAGDQVQPTTYSGFYFQASQISPIGATAATSGALEPAWPTTIAATVYDFSVGTPTPVAADPPAQPTTPAPGTGTGGRYSNPGGRSGGFAQP